MQERIIKVFATEDSKKKKTKEEKDEGIRGQPQDNIKEKTAKE
jgi:hypothetical protein